MTTVEIPVRGMHCAGCEERLSLALRRLEGVREARADRAAEKVTATYDPGRVSEQALRERIELAGFEVS